MGSELRADFLPERAWRGPELFLRAKNCTCVLGRGHPARGPSCPSGVPSSQPCLDLGCRSSWGFPGGSDTKGSACNAGDLGLIPGSGRSPGEGNGNPLQYSCLENPMDRGAWWATDTTHLDCAPPWICAPSRLSCFPLGPKEPPTSPSQLSGLSAPSFSLSALRTFFF